MEKKVATRKRRACVRGESEAGGETRVEDNTKGECREVKDKVLTSIPFHQRAKYTSSIHPSAHSFIHS